jgi:hypothetical protein
LNSEPPLVTKIRESVNYFYFYFFSAVRQHERQCEAVVRTVDSVRLVHVAVCGSVLGSVWQCARHCAAVRHCSSVRQCSSVRRSMRQSVCGSVAACGRAAVCGSVAV